MVQDNVTRTLLVGGTANFVCHKLGLKVKYSEQKAKLVAKING